MTQKQPAPPVPAATVVLLRPGAAGGIEIFMVVRHHRIDFASGALVFPGGKVDAADFADELAPHLAGADADRNMRAMQVACIREAFEESGVLLARPEGSGGLVDAERLRALAAYRNRLHGGELTMAEFAVKEELVFACDQLVHFAHWITPEMMPKRFDTHFFLALAPTDHLAVHDGHESVDSVWINAAEALAAGESGEYNIIFPTARNIAKIAEFPNPEAALRQTRANEVVTVLPWMERRSDGNYLRIPEAAGYDISEERLPDREPSAGEREGRAPRGKEPSAGEREGRAPRANKPSRA